LPYDGAYYDVQTYSEQRYESFPRYEEKVDHRNDEYPMYQNQLEETDDLCKKLIGIEKELHLQSKQKVSYEIICNEPIHSSIPKKEIPFKSEIPKIEPFKGKEDLKEYLI